MSTLSLASMQRLSDPSSFLARSKYKFMEAQMAQHRNVSTLHGPACMQPCIGDGQIPAGGGVEESRNRQVAGHLKAPHRKAGDTVRDLAMSTIVMRLLSA